MTNTLVKKRIEWIDVLRGIAIICVMLSHYDIPFAYFAHKFCVALFFFVSGMLSGSAKRFTTIEYIKIQAHRLLLPYAAFSVINAVFYYIFNRSIGIKGIWDILITFALGKRNTLACAPMWFLPCLFITAILYKIISGLLKKDIAVIFFCLAVSAVAKIFFEEPIMVWSFNHALKYLIYYAIGSVLFAVLKKIDAEYLSVLNPWQKCAFVAFIAVGLWYASKLYSNNLLVNPGTLITACIMVFVNAVSVSALCIAVAVLMSRFKPLAVIGRNTLGFCLGESISRALLNTAMAVTGIGFAANTQLKVIVYNFLAMAISYMIIIVPLNTFCPQLLGKPSKRKTEKANP